MIKLLKSLTKTLKRLSLPLGQSAVGRWFGRWRFRKPATVLAILLVLSAIFYLFFVRAGASTATLVPNADITTGFTVLGGSSDASCNATSTVHCNYVDEGTSASTTDYASTGTGGSTGETEEYDMTTQPGFLSASQIVLNVYAESATNANGGTLDTIAINVRINGTLQTASSCTPAFNTYAYCTATYNGTYSQSDIDSLRAQIVRTRQGSGSPSSQDDDVRIANVYATLTYVPVPNITQASHRWFSDASVDQAGAWTARSSAADSNWQSITYGNGLYVTVSSGTEGVGSDIMTSPDGITWTTRTAAVNNHWNSVIYANSLFVAVGDAVAGLSVMTSPDGITWTSRTATGNAWTSVTYGNSVFVAVASGGQVMTSPDGITWTNRTSAVSNNWNSVTYGNGLFVAVSSTGTGNRVMTSPDGTTWTSRTSAANSLWNSVAYGNSLFVAVAGGVPGVNNEVMTSPDGITWTTRTASSDNSWVAVAYGNGLFVATGLSAGVVMTSPDGTTWTDRTAANSNSWFGITYGNGIFIAVSNTGTGNRVMTSGYGASVGSALAAQDTAATATSNIARLRMNLGMSSSLPASSGVSMKLQYAALTGGSCSNSETYYDLNTAAWSTQTSAADSAWTPVTYGNGLFVAVSYGQEGVSNEVMTSPDGITWTLHTAASSNYWHSVTYGNGLFVAVAGGGIAGTGAVMTSPDGITWTARTAASTDSWASVTYGNGLFVAVANNGVSSSVMTSPDGITWTARTAATSNQWASVTYGNGLFVAVSGTGSGNRVMTSSNGTSWTSRTSAADSYWISVTYGNGLFVAVSGGSEGLGSIVMTSPDGITWTLRTAAVNSSWSSVTYGNGLFVAVAASGAGDRAMVSPDGITWTSQAAATSNQWNSVTYANGRFLAVSSSGSSNRVMTMSPAVMLTSNSSINLASLVSSGSDPTQGGSTINAQSYQTVNSFTNDKTTIGASEYGRWDFPLDFTYAPSATTYCIRAVKSDSTLLNTYTYWPQITTFTPNNVPAAPTLSTPASGATNTFASPQFTLRTTDVEGNYLRYRIYIYQSNCSTLVATINQNSSQTGWSGQDASSSTAYTGASSIGGSTLATYKYTATLAPNTTYCWKADAIDPGGSNTFGSASSTQLFTTAVGEVNITGGITIQGGTTIQ